MQLGTETAHRPWPLPQSPWIMFQSWRNLLFAHWPVSGEVLRALVPAALELDEFEGRTWVSLTPFLLTDLRARGVPAIPRLSQFPEMNLRTYVRVGDRPGIFFFSLDAASLAAVMAARTMYRLPYRHAEMSIRTEADWIFYESHRRDGQADFVGRYRAKGAPFQSAPGTLEHFLVERYALYAVLYSGRVLRGQIHHGPWLLQAAEAVIERNTVGSASGIELTGDPALLSFSARQDTFIWPPEILS